MYVDSPISSSRMCCICAQQLHQYDTQQSLTGAPSSPFRRRRLPRAAQTTQVERIVPVTPINIPTPENAMDVTDDIPDSVIESLIVYATALSANVAHRTLALRRQVLRFTQRE